jgi:hypothetical protein
MQPTQKSDMQSTKHYKNQNKETLYGYYLL